MMGILFTDQIHKVGDVILHSTEHPCSECGQPVFKPTSKQVIVEVEYLPNTLESNSNGKYIFDWRPLDGTEVISNG